MLRTLVMTGLFLATSVGLVAADPAGGVKDLQGSYKFTSVARDGKVAPAEILGTFKSVTIEGDTFTIKMSDEEKVATIRVDSAKTPKTFDLSPSDGPEKGKTLPGIYKVENGELTILFNPPGGTRPTGFDDADTAFMKIVLTKK